MISEVYGLRLLTRPSTQRAALLRLEPHERPGQRTGLVAPAAA